jgi:hypothetical protein
MTSIKVKFRPSIVDDRDGCIYYQIIHNGMIRQLKTNYKISKREWNNGRIEHLRIDSDLKILENIIKKLSNKCVSFTTDDVIKDFKIITTKKSVFNFMCSIIDKLKFLGKTRTSEAYDATLKSFMKYRNYKDISFEEMDSDILLMYEAYLNNRGVTKNTISFYMRILRAVNNRAVERELTNQKTPFKFVYTGIDKTVKRAIKFKYIKLIKNLNLDNKPSLEFARDMFMFSFYTRGMSFIDIANLKNTNLQNGSLFYRRHKTGQLLTIKWEKCMQELVTKYNKLSCYPYIFPIYTTCDKNRNEYKNVLSKINRNLKK